MHASQKLRVVEWNQQRLKMTNTIILWKERVILHDNYKQQEKRMRTGLIKHL